MSRYEQGLHDGKRFSITAPDGRVELLTAKELIARKSRLRAQSRYEDAPSPDAGARRTRNMGGIPRSRAETEEKDPK